MSLAVVLDVINEGNLSIDTESDVIQRQLDIANLEVEKLLGANYAKVVAGTDGYDADDLIIVTKAEAVLSLYFLVPVINTKSIADGGITRSVGLGESQTEYLSQGEALQLANKYRAKAMSLLEDYIPASTLEGMYHDKAFILGVV